MANQQERQDSIFCLSLKVSYTYKLFLRTYVINQHSISLPDLKTSCLILCILLLFPVYNSAFIAQNTV